MNSFVFNSSLAAGQIFDNKIYLFLGTQQIVYLPDDLS